MDKLISHLQKLFQKKKKSIVSKPLIYEPFRWKDVDTSVAQEAIEELNDIIYSAYIDWKVSGQSTDMRLRFFDNGKSRGFALAKPLMTEYQSQMVAILASFIQRCTPYNYIANKSEIASSASDLGMETQYHVYLKPSHRLKIETKANQLFGNLDWIYKVDNDKGVFLRFMSHTYSDHNFHNATSMDEMMESLFK